MAEGTLGVRADETPRPAAAGFFQVHLETRGQYVGMAVAQLQLLLPAVARPPHGLARQVEMRVFRHINNVRIQTVDRVALRSRLHEVAEQFHTLAQSAGIFGDDARGGEVGGKIEPRKQQRAAGVLLLAKAEEIRRVADVRFDLLLAVPEIIVGKDGYNDPAGVTGRDLEGHAVVVAFGRVAPTHAVATLPLGGLLPAWETEHLLGQTGEVGGEDDAAAVPGPVCRIERGVVFRQTWIATVAEDALHKVEITDEAARREEAHLHRFLGDETLHGGTYHRAKQQRDKAFRLGWPRRSEG